MTTYLLKQQTVCVGGVSFRISSLLDLQQYADASGAAAEIGVPPASWSLFGHVWPSARVLALFMHSYDLDGKRILEIGAGLALPSLVMHNRNADVTVSDWHPLSEQFLQQNLLLNQLGPMKYQTGSWEAHNPDLGLFDVIIGSDILYERQQPVQLANFIHRHSALVVQVIIVDPDRGNRVAFCREMTGLGYGYSNRRAAGFTENGDPYKGCFLTFDRTSAGVSL